MPWSIALLSALAVGVQLVLAQPLGSSDTAPEQAPAPSPPAVIYGSGSWGTVSNVFFLMSAFFSDILLIRLMLVLAYLCLLIAGCLTFPDISQWGWKPTPVIVVGPIVWAGVCLLVQLSGFLVVLWDERPIKLPTAEDEALWRCFYRRCGMTRVAFLQVLRCGKWQRFRQGEVLYNLSDGEPMRLHLLYKGRVRLECGPQDSRPVTVITGQLFSLTLANLFGVFVGFQAQGAKTIATAETDTIVFSWDIPALLEMASGKKSVSLPSYWRSFILYCIAEELCESSTGDIKYWSWGTPEPELLSCLAGQKPSHDFVAPLEPNEQQSRSVKDFLMWFFASLNPIVPSGLRHFPNPISGAMARNRVLVARHMAQHSRHLPDKLYDLLGSFSELSSRLLLKMGSSFKRHSQGVPSMYSGGAGGSPMSTDGLVRDPEKDGARPKSRLAQPAPACLGVELTAVSRG